MTSMAFCPGHVTSLFHVPEPGPTPETTGSLGAGLCLSLGARATVEVEPAGATCIIPNEGTRLSPVVATALGEYLLGSREHVRLRLDLDLELPVGQGFGMSGAMTLATLLAADGELGLAGGDRAMLVRHAHAAEVALRTGLGDVVAQEAGGLDVRVRPGLPPAGEVVTRKEEAELMLAWGTHPLHTRTIIDDPDSKDRLRRACEGRLERLEGDATMELLLGLGWEFAREAGLVSGEVASMVNEAARHGRASQAMLGNSIYAMGDLGQMCDAMRRLGLRHRLARVDNVGARLLE